MTAPRPRADTPLRIAVVDYGAGNLVSIEQALTAAGAAVTLARHQGELVEADAIVVPGVGAARPAMARLARAGLLGPIRSWIAAQRPYLGICLGLQLLYERSEEDDATTMRVIPGVVRRLDDAPTLPHIGWNQVFRLRAHPIFDGIEDGADFYFVHSYAGEAAAGERGRWGLAETTHGTPFTSAVAHDNVVGVQFHPERSGPDGLRLLANFVRWASSPTGATA